MEPGLKKVIVLILVVAIAAFSFAATINDVQSNHWAYQSVKELLDKGYLSAYPDNTFRGNEPVDRYTFASVVARMLKEVQSGKVVASSDELETLRKLYEEFHNELGKIFTDINKLNDRVTSLEKGLIANKDEITRLQIDLNNLKPEMATQIEAVFASMNTTKTQLDNKINSLNQDLAELKDSLMGISSEKASSSAVELAITSAIQRASTDIQETTNKDQEKLKAQVDSELDKAFTELDRFDDELGSVKKALNNELVALKLDVTEETANLQKELEAIKTTLTMSGQNFDNLASKTGNTESNLARLQEDFNLFRKEVDEALDKEIEERIAKLETDLLAAQSRMQDQINLIDSQVREDLQSTRSSNFVRERTIENRLEKIEADLKSQSESNTARLEALEKGRNYWWAGFGLSLVAIVVSVVGFTK